MKNLLLSGALLLLGLSSDAQYFQRIYGTVPQAEILTSGHNVVVQPQLGYIMSGDQPAAAGPRLKVIRTNLAGLFPAAPFFSNSYGLNDPNANPLVTGQNKVIELNSGVGFAVTGTSTDLNGITYIYLLVLNPAGGVIAAYDYILPAPYVITTIHSAIAQTAAGNDVYITGHANNGADDDFFVLKITVATGGVVWSGIYDFAGAFDYSSELVENAAGTEVAVVGGTSPAAWGIMDAFLTRLNAATGAHVATNTFGFAASHDYFRSIRQSVPFGGFIVGGATNARNGADMDMWTVGFNAVGGLMVSTVHDHPVNVNAQQVCLDVVERFNTMAQWEYYAVGNLAPGVFGAAPAAPDIQVCKLAANLLGVAGGIFNYGGTGVEDGVNIDIRNGAAGTGLSTFGNTNGSFAVGGAGDFYLIKSYFNGVSPCNTALFGPASANLNFNPVVPAVNVANGVAARQINVIMNVGLPQAQLCFANAIAGGNNAKITPVKPKNEFQDLSAAELGMTIFPNPAVHGEASSIRIHSTNTGVASIAIFDIMGRRCYESAVALYSGYTNFSLEEAAPKLAKGIYTVQISTETQTISERMVIE